MIDYSLMFPICLCDYYEYTEDMEVVEDLFAIADDQIRLAYRDTSGGIVKEQDGWWAHIDWCEGLQKVTSVQGVLLYALDKMITEGKAQPLQTNDHRCAFGHFYYAVQPKNEGILDIWNVLRDKHKQFHAYGGQAIMCLKKDDAVTAREYYNKALEVSEHLIKDFESLIALAEELDKADIRIFE